MVISNGLQDIICLNRIKHKRNEFTNDKYSPFIQLLTKSVCLATLRYKEELTTKIGL